MWTGQGWGGSSQAAALPLAFSMQQQGGFGAQPQQGVFFAAQPPPPPPSAEAWLSVGDPNLPAASAAWANIGPLPPLPLNGQELEAHFARLGRPMGPGTDPVTVQFGPPLRGSSLGPASSPHQREQPTQWTLAGHFSCKQSMNGREVQITRFGEHHFKPQHMASMCDHCFKPIQTETRIMCLKCPDFDYCTTCFHQSICKQDLCVAISDSRNINPQALLLKQQITAQLKQDGKLQ